MSLASHDQQPARPEGPPSPPPGRAGVGARELGPASQARPALAQGPAGSALGAAGAPWRPGERGLPEGADKRQAVRQMFDTIAGHYDLLNSVLSFGLDRGWRRRAVSALALGAGSLVVDIGCGTGDLLEELRRQGLRPVGLDLTARMLGLASARSARHGAPLVLGDALASPWRASCFDGAVSGFALRNVVDLAALFKEAARVVRPGGRISLLELAEPEVPLLRLGHQAWTRLGVPLVGSLLSDGDAYRYLPRSLAYLPPPAEMVQLLEEAGFRAVERRLLSGGATQLYVATRAGLP